MEKAECIVCCKNKTAMLCDSCAQPSCKRCCYYVDAAAFEYLSYLPENIQNKVFCPNCYNDNISKELIEYEEILTRAKNLDIYIKKQSSETRLMRRISKPIKVDNCGDEKDALMRLAFKAAQLGYRTIVDVDLKAKKVGQGSYIKKVWSGFAIPIDPAARARR